MSLSDPIYLMLKALLVSQPEPLITVITQAAVGQNKGGAYVSLYGKYGKFRFCHVYREQWDQLTPEIVTQAQARLARAPVIETVNNREADEKGGLLFDVQPPFTCVRTHYVGSEKKDWIFVGLFGGGSSGPRQPPQAVATTTAVSPQNVATNTPPTFLNRHDALVWATSRGAYPSVAEAEVDYVVLFAEIKPTNAAQMFSAWIEKVRSRR